VAIGVGIAVGFVVILRERRMVARQAALDAEEARAEALAQGEPLAPAGGTLPDEPASRKTR